MKKNLQYLIMVIALLSFGQFSAKIDKALSLDTKSKILKGINGNIGSFEPLECKVVCCTWPSICRIKCTYSSTCVEEYEVRVVCDGIVTLFCKTECPNCNEPD